MSFDTWLAFAIPTFLICVTPGPNMMLMLSIGLQQGLRGALPAMLGAVTVVLLMMVASALGLGLILEQSPLAFTAIKWTGAAYLAYLGMQLTVQSIKPPAVVQAHLSHPTSADAPAVAVAVMTASAMPEDGLNSPSPPFSQPATTANVRPSHGTGQDQRHTSVPVDFWANVSKAVAVAGSNPKAIVFAAAYFPQFINTKAAAWPQLAVLLPTFIVLEGACYVLYALSGQSLAAWFAKPKVLSRFNLGIGVIFIAFGVLLAIN